MKLRTIFWLLFATALHAKSLYVAQTAQGSDTGADAANAHAITWFASATNWGPGGTQINPGDTVHLVGTITSRVWPQASGASAGSPTIILLEPGAKISSTRWDTYGGFYATGLSYITLDGGTNGIVENTDNGTTGTYGQSADSCGVVFDECQYCTVQNLMIRNIYVRNSYTDRVPNYGKGISFRDSAGTGTSHFTATNCTIHDSYTGIYTDYSTGGSHDYNITGCTIYNVNWGIVCGNRDEYMNNGAGSSFANLAVVGNTIYNLSVWDEVHGDNHHDGVFLTCSKSPSYTGTVSANNITIARNKIGPGLNAHDSSWPDLNAAIYIQGDQLASGRATITGCYIYDNLIANDIGTTGGAYIEALTEAGDLLVANNTVIGGYDASHTTATATGISAVTAGNCIVQNNIVTNCSALLTIGTGAASITCDYNIYDISISSPFSTYDGTAPYWHAKTWAQWNALGYDSTGSLNATDPLFVGGGDYHLTGSSPATGAGANLSASFTTDLDGSTRQSSPAAWDIGAYKYTAGAPAAPTAIAATSIGIVSFSANWSAASGATGYALDVATDSGFTSFVSGFQDKDVGDVTTYSVTGLAFGTAYYYRVRAYNGTGTSASSSTITAATLNPTPATARRGYPGASVP